MNPPPSGAAPMTVRSGRFVSALLRSPFGRWVGRSLVLLRVTGRTTGTLFEFPVQYAATATGIVVVPGRPETKQWWRNLRDEHGVDVWRDHRWHRGRAVVLRPADLEYDTALAAYGERWPRVPMTRDQPIVRIAWLDERDQAAAAP